MKKFVAMLLAAVMVLSLAACGGSSAPAETKAPAAADAAPAAEAPAAEGAATAIKIGMIGPLTGDAAVYGNAVANAAQIAVDEVNALGGLQFELNCQDDEHDFEMLAMRKMVLGVISSPRSRFFKPKLWE